MSLVIIVMGVSGAGKTVVGRAVAERLGWHFIEGDEYHPRSNIDKMTRGVPLTDEDRKPWLQRLRDGIADLLAAGERAVVACSALKQDYRDTLRVDPDRVEFVLLHASHALIRERLRRRRGHFMPAALLEDQFQTLQIPADARVLDAGLTVPELVQAICAGVEHQTLPNGEADACGVLLAGLAFPEAPRWHDGRLWFTDQHARRIGWVTTTGRSGTFIEMSDRPGGLGWLPDGTPLVVAMTERRVYKVVAGELVLHADLSTLASFYCNDMLVDLAGRAYVGNFGYDLHHGDPVTPAELILVEPDGTARVVANDLVFPNGCAIDLTANELIVAETFGHRLTRFRVEPDATLTGRAPWADLGDATPDGLCLDAERFIWVASPATGDVRRVARGGAVQRRIEPRGTPYACMLGGDDRRTLFILTSESDDPETAARLKSGRIETIAVGVPGVGLP